MGKPRIDLSEQRFGRLIAVEYVGESKWSCKCDCGSENIVLTAELRRGRTKSCGCLNKELLSKGKPKHGFSHDALYSVRKGMLLRCTHENANGYEYYGARGISICEEWLNEIDGIKNFIEWGRNNGYKKGLQIDRIDNDGNYEPSNCHFVTSRVNNLNSRIQKNNTSGYVGVVWNKRRCLWKATIQIEGVPIDIGHRPRKVDALGLRNRYIVENGIQHEYKIQEYVG